MNPINLRAWREGTWGDGAWQIARAPAVVVQNLLVPVVDPAEPGGRWCKPVAVLQALCLPVRFSSAAHLRMLPVSEQRGCTEGRGQKTCKQLSKGAERTQSGEVEGWRGVGVRGRKGEKVRGEREAREREREREREGGGGGGGFFKRR